MIHWESEGFLRTLDSKSPKNKRDKFLIFNIQYFNISNLSDD